MVTSLGVINTTEVTNMGIKGRKIGFAAKNMRSEELILCLGYSELGSATGISAATLRKHWRVYPDSLVYSSGDWVIMRGEYVEKDLSGYKGNLQNFGGKK